MDQGLRIRLRYGLPAILALSLAQLAFSQANPAAKPEAAIRPETGMPVVQSYSYKEYGSAQQVWTILQDQRGMMYFGVSAGQILQFDGVSWRHIETSSDSIRSLVLDQNGTVWVGADADFGYLTPDASGSLQYVSLLSQVPARDRNFTDVWQVLPTPQGVFFRTYQSLFRWDGHHMRVWNAGPSSSFQALSAVRGVVYTAQKSIGLEKIEGDSLVPMPGGEAYSSYQKLFLYPWDDHHLIVTSREEPLTLYDGEKVTPFHSQADGYLKTNAIYTSTLLSDGSLCVNTFKGGSVIVGRDGSVLQTINARSGLLDDGALSSYQDRSGALWIGTSAGITRVDIGSPIRIYSRLTIYDVRRFHGDVYGTSGVGLAPVFKVVFDPRTGLPHDVPVKGPSQGFIFLVFHDAVHGTPDQLLVGTSEGVDRVEGDHLVPSIPALEKSSGATFDVEVSRKNPSRVYAGHSDGVSSMHWDGHVWIDEGRLPHVVFPARSVTEDNDGNLWAGGAIGRVLRIRVAPAGLGNSTYEVLGQAAGLPDGTTQVSMVAGSLMVMVANAGHNYRWNPATHRFVVDDRFLLRVDEPKVTYFVASNPDGSVWSNAVNEAQRLLRIGLFTKGPDGQWRLDENTWRPIMRFADIPDYPDGHGAFWFAGENLIRFAPPKNGAAAPPPFLTLVREVSSGTRTIYGGAAEGAARFFRLPAGTRALLFHFAALNYDNPAGTEYEYYLEGADRDWSPWSRETAANYSGLGPGSYRFRVRARADDGRLGQEADFAFTIQPPWYETVWAWALCVLLFLMITWLVWRSVIRYERASAQRRTAALEVQAKELEATVSARTQEIRAQAAEISAQKESIELLSQIGREITASLDLNTILFKLYERVNQIVDASIFGVGLYRPDKRLIEYSLAIENGKRYAPYTRSTEDKNQLAVWCIEHRKPILLNDVSTESSKYIASYDHGSLALEDGSIAQPPASMIYLPLIAQDRVLGVLSIQSFRKYAYTEQHLRLLENLAAYTTIALDNANAYQTINQREREVSERAAELITINRITQALASQLDRNRLIEFVGDQVRDVFHAPVVYVALLDRAAMMLHFPYTWGEEAPSRSFGTGLTSQIIRTGQPLLINEDLDASRNKMGIERVGVATASYLGVPIHSGGQTIGVISVQSTDEEGRFTEADQRLLSTIASAVGVAFYNARLFDEARQARSAAEEADAAKSSFLSTVSHELRTPLTSVLGFAKIIRRRLQERLFPLIPDDDRKVQQAKQQVIENLNVVVSEGERLTKLIDDVLDLAKIEAGKFTWNMGTVSIADVIERATAATASLFEAKKLQLIRDVDPDLPSVTGDQDRLIQVVINLISNAVKFTDSGSIACAARLQENELVVTVKDSGIGIAAADQAKVFEKFKQVGDTLTDKPKGTGLGLPICKEIVEYHGGRIWVESAPGKGSTFLFTLPIVAKPAQLSLLPEKRSLDFESLVRQLRVTVSGQNGHSKSVLVVDDDPNIRSLLQQELTEAGYGVRLAEDGRQALALIREETPGLVILDVMMPEMNGFDVAAVLKNDPATMDIPIIILSIVEDKERGIRLGVDRYLTKPIDTRSLFHEVDSLLGQGKSKKKVMVVDEDSSTIRTLTDVLEARGYQVVDSDGRDLLKQAVASRPDIIILNSLLSGSDGVRSLRFEKGLENVLFLIYS
ncbi:MAG TPA: GAF domain-containing protein [Acidobacteriaceae bacterium]|nr:GAF domain-containing protein [Acidobacteriaceae bacterium]